MKKVSFDFDSTLTKPCIQRYAKYLIDSGFEVHITTSRCLERYGIKYDNSDLFKIAQEIGIDGKNITFTNAYFKADYLADDFIFHLDDDKKEIEKIKNVVAINVNESWCIKKCNEVIRQNVTT